MYPPFLIILIMSFFKKKTVFLGHKRIYLNSSTKAGPVQLFLQELRINDQQLSCDSLVT